MIVLNFVEGIYFQIKLILKNILHCNNKLTIRGKYPTILSIQDIQTYLVSHNGFLRLVFFNFFFCVQIDQEHNKLIAINKKIKMGKRMSYACCIYRPKSSLKGEKSTFLVFHRVPKQTIFSRCARRRAGN
jgi:hypothetical protein